MKPPSSKIAIIHDVFIEFGGAERVLLELLTIYPHADVYIPLLTTSKRQLVQQHTTGKIHTSGLNVLPFVHSASILLKPLLFWYWQSLDLAGYDVVISSSHSFSSKAVITGAQTRHISYVHTPPRYLYVEYNETRILRSPLFRALLSPLLSWLRAQDYLAAQRPDILIANSQTVHRRITKYYRRTAELLYPPIQIPTTSQLTAAKRKWATVLPQIGGRDHADRIAKVLRPGKFFVCFSRLAKQKGLDLAIRTCVEKKLPLLIVGQGAEEGYLKSLAGYTTVFSGAVSDAVKSTLLTNAAALIYCSIEEDFGMVTAEALAHGLPVIGYESGGTAEIVSRRTGVLFKEFSIASLSQAIATFNRSRFSALACRRQAQRFSAARFDAGFKRLVHRRQK